ncbi:unnamed protein product, partial [marine sediment metagenome]
PPACANCRLEEQESLVDDLKLEIQKLRDRNKELEEILVEEKVDNGPTQEELDAELSKEILHRIHGGSPSPDWTIVNDPCDCEKDAIITITMPQWGHNLKIPDSFKEDLTVNITKHFFEYSNSKSNYKIKPDQRYQAARKLARDLLPIFQETLPYLEKEVENK